MSRYRLLAVVAIVFFIIASSITVLWYSSFREQSSGGDQSPSTTPVTTTTYTLTTTTSSLPHTGTYTTYTNTSVFYREGGVWVYRGCVGDWCYSLLVYPNCTSVFSITYNGSGMDVENPLLPLTAGLQFVIVKPSGNLTVRKPGLYYYNQTVTIEHGLSDSISFSLLDAEALYVYGRILGKIPFTLYITLPYPLTTVTVHPPYSTTTKPLCNLELEGVYSEPMETGLEVIYMDNGTLVRNGVVEVFIQRELVGEYTPILRGYIKNIGDTPIEIYRWRADIVLLNISSDGVEYAWVGKELIVYVPSMTVLPPPCRIPGGYEVIYRSDILYPGENTSIEVYLANQVDSIEIKGWMYLEITLKYTPIKELYNIVDNGYLDYIKAGKTYNTKTITFTIQTHREQE